jgi:two-component system, chemotaxis family, protein-glutamate methylesterase/glutaminase
VAASGLTVVALVASAGGLDALRTVLAGLPAELPAAVLTLQHTSPSHLSTLHEILATSSALPVEPATDGAALTAGRVLVAPAGSHTLITAELTVSLVASGAFPPSRPSGDLLLTTLALAAGPRAVAVVLTGGGQDGATGATAIRKHGGTVLVTDEATSQVFSMPSATIERDTIHPTVLPLELVADALTRLVTPPTR